jgi:catechol 2,3-dioxygenase-like lactoylglutathione lyase family enzyme
MKRLHVHVSVTDLAQSIGFYRNLFGSEPGVVKDDYAKWMLDDPRVNFAISVRDRRPGLDHLGIQVEAREQLAEVSQRLHDAELSTIEQTAADCCYARSDKSWVSDPQGVVWETFYTFDEITVYGDDTLSSAEIGETTGACCNRPSGAA